MPADPSPDNQASGQISAETVYEEMEPFVPYTTRELADTIDTSLGNMWSILRGLAGEGRIRKKQPEPNIRIWMREPPDTNCSYCGCEFEVKFLHPASSSSRYCPNCGSQVSDIQ
jgi:hypothetical protein